MRRRRLRHWMSFHSSSNNPCFATCRLDLAASVIAHFPYYHQYVLLHSLPAGVMRALVDRISPDDRMRLFDELPEEAWQRLMDELSGAAVVETPSGHEPETQREPEPQLPEPGETLIEGRQIEKSYAQPDGRDIQIIAPMDLAVESGIICALAWAFWIGKIDLAENSVGIDGAIQRHGAGAWAAAGRRRPQHWHGLPEFCFIPLADGAGEC